MPHEGFPHNGDLEREQLLQSLGAQQPVVAGPQELLPAQLTPAGQELQLKEQLLNTLIPLRNIQMQQELGAIAKEREAEIAKEANAIIGDNAKKPGKQAGTENQDPRMNLLQQMLAQQTLG